MSVNHQMKWPDSLLCDTTINVDVFIFWLLPEIILTGIHISVFKDFSIRLGAQSLLGDYLFSLKHMLCLGVCPVARSMMRLRASRVVRARLAMMVMAVLMAGAHSVQAQIGGQSLSGVGNTMTLTDETIVTAGGVTGVMARSGAVITLSGGSVTTTGGGQGLSAELQGATINATDVIINTSVPAGGEFLGATVGASTNTDGTINLIRGSIETSGRNAYGLWTASTGSEINATGTTILTHGDNATGAEFSGNGETTYGLGVMNLTDVNITTEGIKAYGAAQSGSYVVTNGGAPVINPTPITLIMNGGSITTLGAQAAGLFGNSLTLSKLTDVS
ncbi:MAG: hypothetical protein LBQ09_05355, partial [Acidobacteriaceae bacterium]|nr:hypothetical protein [Acidobacteriaceae bacterium]